MPSLGFRAVREFVNVVDEVIALGQKAVGASDRDRYLAFVAASTPYLVLKSENHKAERPLAYLEKYLSGENSDLFVDLFELLAEDKAVRTCVQSKIARYLDQWALFVKTGVDPTPSQRYRLINELGLKPDRLQYKVRLDAATCRELLIDVQQSDFSVNDWLNATGSFQLNWELVDMCDSRESAIVKLWGRNTYRWHPDAPRPTQRLHQALEILKKYGASDFDIVFRPVLMGVSSGALMRD
jgi:hypothetical protein